MLILFFALMLMYQVFPVMEGMDNNTTSDTGSNTYKPYDMNAEPLILAQQNAGNISYLKQRLDEMGDVRKWLEDLSGNVASLQTQVNGLVQAQQEYANQMTGGTPPTITGAVDEEDAPA